jgi:hypothetical protein
MFITASVRKADRLVLFRETIAVHCENIERTFFSRMQCSCVLKQVKYIVTTRLYTVKTCWDVVKRWNIFTKLQKSDRKRPYFTFLLFILGLFSDALNGLYIYIYIYIHVTFSLINGGTTSLSHNILKHLKCLYYLEKYFLVLKHL